MLGSRALVSRLRPRAGRSSSCSTGPGVLGRDCANIRSDPMVASRFRWPAPRPRRSLRHAWMVAILLRRKQNSRRRQVVDRVDGLIETFILERLSTLRSGARAASRLRNDVVPRWGTKSIHEIKRRDVVEFVSEVNQRGPGAGRNIAKYLKTFFRWCVGRAVLDFSPVEGLNLRTPDRSRDRALNDVELASVLITARQMPGTLRGDRRGPRPYRPATRRSCTNGMGRTR